MSRDNMKKFFASFLKKKRLPFFSRHHPRVTRIRR